MIELLNIANTYKNTEDKHFEMKELVDLLGDLFLTIPLSKREPLSLFSNPFGRLVDIGEVISRAFMTLMRSPRFTDIYLEKSELIDIFTKHTAIPAEDIKIIIEKREETCYKHLQEIQKILDSLPENMVLVDSKNSDTAKDQIGEEENYFLEEAYRQKDNFSKNEIKTALEFGKLLKEYQKILTTQYNELLIQPKERLLDAQDTYNPSKGSNASSKTIARVFGEMVHLPNRTGPTDNSEIKNALMKYGALYEGVHCNSEYYNTSKNSFYYDGPQWANRAINIVGWDDNYDKALCYIIG